MDELGELKILETMLLLLPGFVTAEIVGVLVLREERKTLDRIIQALIYTFLAHVLWTLVGRPFGEDSAGAVLGLGLCAVVWGLFFTWTINSGFLHTALRWLRLTRAASRPNEWYDAFYDRRHYVILHLNDARRVFGWPRLYPFQPNKGHILLEGAEWLDRPRSEPTQPRRVDFLIGVNDVRFVEFIPPKKPEIRNE